MDRINRILALLEPYPLNAFPRVQLARSLAHAKHGQMEKARVAFEAASRASDHFRRDHEAGDALALLVDGCFIELLLTEYGCAPKPTALDGPAWERVLRFATGEPALMGYIRTLRCLWHTQTGRFSLAFEHGLAAIDIFRRGDSPYGELFIHMHLGMTELGRGRVGAALEEHQRALRIVRAVFPGDRGVRRICNIALGEAYWELGDDANARRHLRNVIRHINQPEAWFDLYMAAYQTSLEFLFTEGGTARAEQFFREASEHASRQGLSLHCTFWPAAGTPKGTLVLVHGHGIHCAFEFLRSLNLGARSGPRVYAGSWVERLNAEGWSCAGIDHQSHGRSEAIGGYPNFIESFDDFVGDLEEFCDGPLERLGGRAFSAGLPRVLFGCSLGGAVATKALLQRPNLAQALVLLSPMLSLEKVAKKGSNRYLRPMMEVVNRWFPTLQVVKVERCPIAHFQEEFNADPLNYHGGTRVRNAQCYLYACAEIMRRCEELEVPFITNHSADDPYTDPDGSTELVRRAKSSDKTLNLVQGMWHVINHEPGNEKILDTIVEWLGARF